MNSSFFIVADRGNLKAFRAESPVGRGPSLKAVKSVLLAEAHLKASEKYSDGAGGFQEQNGAGGQQSVHQNSVGEKHYELEENRRTVRQLAEQITEILQSEKVDRWSLAAPAQILEQVLSEMDASWRGKVCEKVPAGSRAYPHGATARAFRESARDRRVGQPSGAAYVRLPKSISITLCGR